MATDGDVVVVSVAAVEDLVLLLQPLSANPARIMLNKIVFFIGGLICPATDHVIALQFAFGPTVNSARRKMFFAANAGAFFCLPRLRMRGPSIVLARNDEQSLRKHESAGVHLIWIRAHPLLGGSSHGNLENLPL